MGAGKWTSPPSPQPLLMQGSANFFCKGSESKYFGFGGHVASVTTIQRSMCRQYVNKWSWLCCPYKTIDTDLNFISSSCVTKSFPGATVEGAGSAWRDKNKARANMLRMAEQKAEGACVSDGLPGQLNTTRSCPSLIFLLQEKRNPLVGTTDTVAYTTNIYLLIVLKSRSLQADVVRVGLF